MSEVPSQRRRQNPNRVGESSSSSSQTDDLAFQNEIIVRSVFASMKWDVQALCQMSSVNRRLRALAKRLLWKEMCIHRAPRMIASLMDGAPNGRIGGEWDAMAKLLFFCCGCNSTRHFHMGRSYPGHFVKSSRFSKTSGRSFLVKRCRTDLLYVSDPCEHQIRDRGDDLGIFRGVFGGFTRSKTRACLITKQLEGEEGVRCPFCGGRVWSMTAARLVPRSAARRLGTLENGLEYFVCVNGHLHGSCWLVPLSSDEDGADKDVDGDENGDKNDGYRRNQIVEPT
ncbi:EID1-like F-box protein 3 [Capsicum annuum]|uniref:EID1-like F-box protein 3 n=1 Tax=Capsicum annuum TaxID=4072 RepID=A0A1U8F1T7_CAPAN|nr:EID1-like F-box protein 3 [Capsicum annuum]KAF3636035.1 EID1-like F-box protein 3 [Capsicum annuum]PHT70799.1 EID1-like F-box protein 3 [Capsicum annuum]